jgi:hypothetical protein
MATPADPDVGSLTPPRGGGREPRPGTLRAAPYNDTVAALCPVGGVVALHDLRPLHDPRPLHDLRLHHALPSRARSAGFARSGTTRTGPARPGTPSGSAAAWTVIALRARPPAALVLVPASAPSPAPPMAGADPAGADPPVVGAVTPSRIAPGVGPTAIRSAATALEAAVTHREGSLP